MSFCPRCVKPVDESATTCAHCGYAIPAPIPAMKSFRADGALPAPVPPAPPRGTGPFPEPPPRPSSLPPPSGAPVATAPPAPPTPMPVAAAGPVPAAPAADPFALTTVIAPASRPRSEDRAQPAGRSKLPWVIGLLALLAVVVVVVVLVAGSGGHGSPPVAASGSSSAAAHSSTAVSSGGSAADAKAQASAVAGYLTESTAARTGVSDAIVAISSCKDITASVAALQNAATVRQRIVSELSGANLDAVPGGPALLAELTQALQASAASDGHYAAWGTAVAASCSGTAAHTAEWTAAQQSDSAANSAKQKFVAGWNPIATQYGLPQQSTTSF